VRAIRRRCVPDRAETRRSSTPASPALAQQSTRVPIETPAALEPINVSVESVVYRGRQAIKVVEAPAQTGPTIAVVSK
jgi:hypothetical protein